VRITEKNPSRGVVYLTGFFVIILALFPYFLLFCYPYILLHFQILLLLVISDDHVINVEGI